MSEVCPGCQASLEPVDGPTHRYIGASPACWRIYTTLLGGGYAVVGGDRYGSLLVDAYAAQHPGVDSQQARQSVAVHLVTLWAILKAEADVEKAIDIRVRAVSVGKRTGGFQWLEPAPSSYPLTVADLTSTEPIDASSIDLFVGGVLGTWMGYHEEAIRKWHDLYRQDFRA
ncbi:MAG TPA: DUF5946 family protein [Acidimicrobiia bacterium]|nr:DUF5946 family protein [Acidimicrobiia bacterium]